MATKQWYVYTETGECVEAFNVHDAIRTLRRWYTGELNVNNVLVEEEFDRREKLVRGEVV